MKTVRIVGWIAALVSGAGTLHAATYDVGSGQTYANLAALPALVPGDVVQVHAGTYNEVKRWTDSGTAGSPITIRGIGATRPIFDATGKTVDGALPNPRAVFQIEGGNIVVENLEFTNARNGDNGAGIRVTGGSANHVVIRNCKVHHNDMGIMSDGNDDLLVDSSEISENGTDLYSGFSHNFYLGGNRTTVQYSYIHDSLYGQNVKSRGHFTALLYNYIADSQDGEVGLVDGADTTAANSNAVLIGNVVVSKPRGAAWNHGRFVWFGQDSGGAHNGTLYVINNTFMAGDSRIYFLDANVAGASIWAANNVFWNSDTIAGGTGIGPVTGQNNWIPSSATAPSGFYGTTFQGSDPGFVNAAGRDFHLLSTSPLIDKAAEGLTYDDGTGTPQSASPLFEYVRDLSHAQRHVTNIGADIGAYEYATNADGGGAGGSTGSGGSNGTGGAANGGSANGGSGGTAPGAGGASVDASAGGSSTANGGAEVGGGAVGNGGAPGSGGRGAGGSAAGASGNGTAASAGSSADAGTQGAHAEDSGGCGCTLAARTSPPSVWLLVVGALLGAARRRYARSAQRARRQ